MKILFALAMVAALSGCANHPLEYCRTSQGYSPSEMLGHELACAVMLFERPQKPFLVPSLEPATSGEKHD